MPPEPPKKVNRLWETIVPPSSARPVAASQTIESAPMDRHSTSLRLLFQDTERILQDFAKKHEELLAKMGNALKGVAGLDEALVATRVETVAELKNLGNLQQVALQEQLSEIRTSVSKLAGNYEQMKTRLDGVDESVGRQVSDALGIFHKRLDDVGEQQTVLLDAVKELGQQLAEKVSPIAPAVRDLRSAVETGLNKLNDSSASERNAVIQKIDDVLLCTLRHYPPCHTGGCCSGLHAVSTPATPSTSLHDSNPHYRTPSGPMTPLVSLSHASPQVQAPRVMSGHPTPSASIVPNTGNTSYATPARQKTTGLTSQSASLGKRAAVQETVAGPTMSPTVEPPRSYAETLALLTTPSTSRNRRNMPPTFSQVSVSSSQPPPSLAYSASLGSSSSSVWPASSLDPLSPAPSGVDESGVDQSSPNKIDNGGLPMPSSRKRPRTTMTDRQHDIPVAARKSRSPGLSRQSTERYRVLIASEDDEVDIPIAGF